MPPQHSLAPEQSDELVQPDGQEKELPSHKYGEQLGEPELPLAEATQKNAVPEPEHWSQSPPHRAALAAQL